MRKDTIYLIVEGHGEAQRGPDGGDPAAVVLLSRILAHLRWYALHVGHRPHRLASYGAFFRDDRLERAIRRWELEPDCAAVLVLLDMDDACPVEEAAKLVERIRRIEPLTCSVAVVCAKREFEAWILAGVSSLGGQAYDQDPEARRDAKGWLRVAVGYRPTRDQAAYARQIDLEVAAARSRSFRRLRHALEELVEAEAIGRMIVSPQVRGAD